MLIISALDTFIHDLVRLGMLEILRSQRKQTEAYQTFKVSMQVVRFDAHYDWFEDEIKRRHRFESFQNPRHITEALKLISKLDLWEQVAKKLNQGSESIKKQLDGIVKRRDQIAHEADLRGDVPHTPWDIEPQDVKEAVNFIENLVEAIYQVLA